GGLWDFSLEAGAPRTGYGVDGGRYHVDETFLSWTLRDGLTDWLTVEGHGEFARDLQLVGGGAVFSVFGRGAITAEAAVSRTGRSTGGLWYVDGETRFGRATIHLSTQRTIGRYEDIAGLSADAGFQNRLALRLAGSASPGAIAALLSTRPARRIDRASIGIPFGGGESALALSWTEVRPATGDDSRILGLSGSTALFGGRAFASLSADFGDRRSLLGYVGWSRPLGEWGQGAVGLASGRGRTQAVTTLSRGLGTEPGAWGWRIVDQESDVALRSAEISHRTSFARVTGRVGQSGNAANGSVEMEGAVAAMGDGVFVATRIEDAFAVVDAGAPGVTVLAENRPVGVTDARGRLLVPTLRASEVNRLALDATTLPLEAQPAVTEVKVRPRMQSGVSVDFGVVDGRRSAEVALVDEAGGAIELGRSGRTNSGVAFSVGYDGRAWLTDLTDRATVEIDGPSGACRAEVDLPGHGEPRRMIGPVVCRRIQ
ncbi:MAG: fimbria/pilus outer membrane usher protein, partial [Siculibacillus sp.]|nr:fimbria/pilus outer membrane usher protein [Siculibacillus sp.]